MDDSYETSVTEAQRQGVEGISKDDVAVNCVIPPELEIDDAVIELERTDDGMTYVEGGSVDPVDAEDIKRGRRQHRRCTQRRWRQ